MQSDRHPPAADVRTDAGGRARRVRFLIDELRFTQAAYWALAERLRAVGEDPRAVLEESHVEEHRSEEWQALRQ